MNAPFITINELETPCLATDLRLAVLEIHERWTWVVLQSLAKAQGPTLPYNPTVLANLVGVKAQALRQTVNKLQGIGLLSVQGELLEQLTTKQMPLREVSPAGPIAEFSRHSDLLKNVSHKTQRNWIDLYKDVEWINSEIIHAENWLTDKAVTKRNIGAFISNWLKRSGGPNVKPIRKPDVWEPLAQKVMMAIRKYPAGDPGLASAIGDDWWWISKARILNTARAMDANEWSIKRLAQMLKDARVNFPTNPPSQEAQ